MKCLLQNWSVTKSLFFTIAQCLKTVVYKFALDIHLYECGDVGVHYASWLRLKTISQSSLLLAPFVQKDILYTAWLSSNKVMDIGH